MLRQTPALRRRAKASREADEMASRASFAAWAKERGIDDSTFPHAEAGYKAFVILLSLLKAGIIFAMVSALSSSLLRLIDEKTFGSNGLIFDGLDLVFIKIPEIKSPMAIAESLVASAGNVSKAVLPAVIVLSAIAAVVYIALTLMRWQCWERNCLASDFSAHRTKKRVLSTLAVKRRLREAKRAAEKSGGQDSNEPTVDSAAKVSALRSLKSLKVRRHVRDTADNTGLKVTELVTIAMPPTEAEREALMSVLKDFDKTLTRVEEGSLNFGDMLITTDYSRIEFKAEKVIEDPYDWEVDEETGEAVEYWRSFPIDIVRSESDDTIDEKREEAKAWAEKTAASVDKMLTTKQSAVNRISVTCSSTVALIRYEMSFQLDVKKFESMQEALNNAFRTTGCSARVDMGDLLISIPLPKGKTIPISITKMYEEVFG